MSGDGFESMTLYHSLPVLVAAISLFLSAATTGTAIKLMDEAVDLPYDTLIERPTLARHLSYGVTPYALLALAVGFALQPQAALVLFCGAYAVGMAGDWERKLPSGLRGYQEALFALLISVWGAGVKLALAGFGVLLAIQILDDLQDATEDRRMGAQNLVHRWGRFEACAAGLSGLALAAWLSPALGVAALSAVPFVTGAMERLAAGGKGGPA